MRSLQVWLNEYSNDHQNQTNQRLHKICVPAIFFSVVAALHDLPLGFTFPFLGYLGIGDLLLIAAAIWYATLGAKALLLMLAQAALALALSAITPWWLLALIFIVAWIGQFYGHAKEGRRPSFFKDLQYLLIGPLWVWLGH